MHDSSELDEQFTKSLTPRLGLVLGEQYIIPFKLTSPAGGAPKGMEVELVDIILKPGVMATWDSRRRHHTVTASQVHCVLVRVTLGAVRKRVLAQGMPPGVIALAPTSLPVALQFQGVTDHFALNQLPLTPGFARTLHKVQGQKKLAVVVYPEPGTSGAFAYCGLSRCPTMAGARLLSFLNDDPVWYKRSFAEIIDFTRLELLNIATRRLSLETMGGFTNDDVEDTTEEAEERLQMAMRLARIQCDCLLNGVGDPRKKKKPNAQPAVPVLGSTLAPALSGTRKAAAESQARNGKKKVHAQTRE